MTYTAATRCAVERLIVRELIRHMVRAGWSPYSNDDGGEHVYCPTEARAMDTVFSVDESRLHFAPAALVQAIEAVHAQKAGVAPGTVRAALKSARAKADAACHAVLLICGNAEDIISDWSYSDGDADGFNKAVSAFAWGPEGGEGDHIEKLVERALGAGLQALEALRAVLDAARITDIAEMPVPFADGIQTGRPLMLALEAAEKVLES